MDGSFLIDVPEPAYRIGAMVLALINYQPRRARIEQASLTAHITVNAEGPFLESDLRWEYIVTVFNEPVEESEEMTIAEKTILFEIHPDDGGIDTGDAEKSA